MLAHINILSPKKILRKKNTLVTCSFLIFKGFYIFY